MPPWLRLLALPFVLALLGSEPQEPQKGKGKQAPVKGLYKAQITPHWFADNTRFWYRNDLRDGFVEFVLVDAVAGTRGEAFDHGKLAKGLSTAAGKEYRGDKLPFAAIEFVDEQKAVRFRVGGTSWKCNLQSYECTKAEPVKLGVAGAEALRSPGEPDSRGVEDSTPATQGDLPDAAWLADFVPRQRRPDANRRSPDEKWAAVVKDHNVHLRAADGSETPLSTDGTAGDAYGPLFWSPDSKTLVAFRVAPGDRKQVHLIASSPPGGGRATLASREYPLPGDKFPSYELNLFDVATKKQTKPKVDRIDFGFPQLRWKPDRRHFTYQKVDRGHQRFRLVEVDSHTGAARDLIDEKSSTFIWTAHTERRGIGLTFLDKTDEIVYASERDGWRHLYLIDAKARKVKHPITTGEWVVRGVDRVDEDKRQVWFRASGRNAGQDPYLIHHYRIDLDGKNLVALTEADGNHTVAYSPDRKYLIDTYTRVDLPPVHDLRRVADGKLVCHLEKADVTELQAAGYAHPEVFTAKGRDGTTDIWGVLHRPRDYDPNKKYPALEYIYAGPHDSHVPKTFSPFRRFANLTDLGFIVVQIDGMGTANRSKAFHDVCWHNLKDAGFPDRILWHKAVAKKYSYYDTSRVGIFGTSAGGQNAMGALLFHGDFYKAAVAACGCHDNRMDKASWNEQWMGYPVGPQYAASSNVDHAHRLKGKLLLIVGEVDTNVPPESTLRVVDALIKANKDFDLLVMPNVGHSNGGQYGDRRLRDFFVKHLQGREKETTP